jgi:hypothetical protein
MGLKFKRLSITTLIIVCMMFAFTANQVLADRPAGHFKGTMHWGVSANALGGFGKLDGPFDYGPESTGLF